MVLLCLAKETKQKTLDSGIDARVDSGDEACLTNPTSGTANLPG
jgi:hypothetical protein